MDIELRAVTKTFGPVRALVGVTARFSGGEVVVVEGPNGAGKSTLLSLLGALSRPTSGQVIHRFGGMSREGLRHNLGWLGHESLCYPDLTGRENLELCSRLYGLDPTVVFRRAEERFELGAFAERPIRTCSRGQRQRVALARALVHGPKLLLLDEPTTGLDRRTVARLVETVREEAARGVLVVVVTHDSEFAGALAGRALVLERGRVVRGE